ncbi:hypothetical protein G7046_g9328 [Stylonectria norvegica]|nr:hypothetical protein G7046_g9328 [Stylonectria norvegica]
MHLSAGSANNSSPQANEWQPLFYPSVHTTAHDLDEMSLPPNEDSKRVLSPYGNDSKSKRTRSLYIVETPGGSLRETSPTKVFKAPAAQLRLSALSDMPPPQGNGDPSDVSKDESDEKSCQEPNQEPNRSTVRDTLLAGIRQGFAREQESALSLWSVNYDPHFRVQDSHVQDMSTAAMQNMMDYVNRMPGRLHPSWYVPNIIRNQGGSEAVNHKLLDKRPGSGQHTTATKEALDRHFANRIPYMTTASDRLQVLTGMSNSNPFYPYQPPPRLPSHAMPVWEFGGVPREPNGVPRAPWIPKNLQDFLECASRKHGYKMLEVDTLSFKSLIKNDTTYANLDDIRESLKKSESPLLGQYSTLMNLDTKKGSITMYETNIMQASGVARTWVWVVITKPLFDFTGRAPAELANRLHPSSMVFTIPTLKVMKLGEAYIPPLAPLAPKPREASAETPQASGSLRRLSGYRNLNSKAASSPVHRQLHLTFRFSQDGIPSFDCSGKPEILTQKGIVQDFLWAKSP